MSSTEALARTAARAARGLEELEVQGPVRPPPADPDRLDRPDGPGGPDRARAERAPMPGDAPPAVRFRLDPKIPWDELSPRGPYARVGRPLLDLVLLALSLPLALALGAPIALANAILFRSPRKVFFTQPRVGHRGRVFRIVKFRTMAEAPEGSGGSWSSWAAGRDRLRVTRFGRFLRNTHLDELPQLLNVLRGEMRFIGPRPEMVEVEAWAEREVPGFGERLAIRPGITGYAQITQGYTSRDAGAYALKLEHNRRYLRRMGLAADLAILARTAVWILRGRGWRWNQKG